MSFTLHSLSLSPHPPPLPCCQGSHRRPDRISCECRPQGIVRENKEEDARHQVHRCSHGIPPRPRLRPSARPRPPVDSKQGHRRRRGMDLTSKDLFAPVPTKDWKKMLYDKERGDDMNIRRGRGEILEIVKKRGKRGRLWEGSPLPTPACKCQQAKQAPWQLQQAKHKSRYVH